MSTQRMEEIKAKLEDIVEILGPILDAPFADPNRKEQAAIDMMFTKTILLIMKAMEGEKV